VEVLIEYLADIEVCNDFSQVKGAEPAMKIAKHKILTRLKEFPVKVSLHPMAVYPLIDVGYRVPVKIMAERPCLQLLRAKLRGIPVHPLSTSEPEKIVALIGKREICTGR
jgi:hypothetical protein